MQKNHNVLLAKKLKKYAFLFQFIPFIRCFILNGSVALSRANEQSDIDILIIVEEGRIFTANFLTHKIAQLFKLKICLSDTNKYGKFCFNFFISTSHLKLPSTISPNKDLELYQIYNYQHAILIFGDKILFEKFIKNIDKIKFPNTKQENIKQYFPAKEIKLIKLIKLSLEFLLKGRFGKFCEESIYRKILPSFEKNTKNMSSDLVNFTHKVIRIHALRSIKEYFPDYDTHILPA